MCGIIGIVGHNAVSPLIADALTMLQHRGQDAAGIATLDGQRLNLHKNNGLVADVFGGFDFSLLKGHAGIGRPAANIPLRHSLFTSTRPMGSRLDTMAISSTPGS
jgi:glutamine phosphoribosylpyrophosphate amidotransferase